MGITTLQLRVILSEAKNLAYEAWGTLHGKHDPGSYERSLAPLGMTSKKTI